MLHRLKLHPDSRCAAVSRIEVEAMRLGGSGLALSFAVTGATGGLRLPPPAAPERTDGLWQQTCFEAFLREPAGDAYYEFNLAPSTQWAAYAFDGYREGMRAAKGFGAPDIQIRCGGGGFELRALLDLDGLPDFVPQAACRLGLSAVIEETDGSKSYWALAHPPGQPDFHHSDCFALELPAALRP
ncbi:MAG: DOMON-like domain-containing protein [Alphaproteobacteria bacterium]